MSTDASHFSSGWLSDEDYARVQDSVPIACSDALLWREGNRGLEYGLILRNAPHGGQVWCLIGGRIRHGEDPVRAIDRHLVETVGDDVAQHAPRWRGLHALQLRRDSGGRAEGSRATVALDPGWLDLAGTALTWQTVKVDPSLTTPLQIATSGAVQTSIQ